MEPPYFSYNEAQRDRRAQLLEALKETGIAQVACKKTGVGRATYYRWRKEEPGFAEEADAAIEHGANLVSEMAESKLIAAIREGNLTAIIYWLKHRHAKFRTRIDVSPVVESEKLTPEQEEKIRKALEFVGLLPPPAPDNHGTDTTDTVAREP